MQKKTKETKKNKVSKPAEKNVLPVENQPTEEQKKVYSKSLSFFAIFIFCVAVAALYPYLTQTSVSYVTPKLETKVPDFRPIEPRPVPVVQEVKEEPTPVADCSAQEQTILSQKKSLDELNEKIHQLELENLSLKEKTSSSEKSNMLTARLVNEIHNGKPFKASLDALLKENPTDSFALTVQEKLGDYALSGIATAEGLKEMFSSQLKMAQNSLYAGKDNDSWNQKCTNFFKSLVHVYPQDVDDQETNPDNLLFLIRQQVNDGQFESAITNIEKLPDSSKQFLINFVQNAKRYIEMQKVINGYLQK